MLRVSPKLSVLNLVALLIFIGIATSYAEPKQGKLKVGVLFPLSGDYSQYSQLVWRGIQLVVGSDFEWVIEDTGTQNAKAALTSANRLLEVDRVSLILGYLVDEVEWYHSAINRSKVPLLVVWDSNKRLTEMGPYTFSVGYSSDGAGIVAANYLQKRGKIKRVAILSEEGFYNHIVVDAFKQRAPKVGLEVTSEDWYALGEKDFRTILLRAKSQKPDALFYMPSLTATYDAMLRQYKELGLDWAIQTNELIVPDPEAAKTRSIVDSCGFWFPDDHQKEIVAAYKKKYGEEPWNPGVVGLGYDAGKFLAEKVLNQPRSPYQSLRAGLGPTRILPDRQFAIWCWENGKLVRKT